jgi:hypothetical protein
MIRCARAKSVKVAVGPTAARLECHLYKHLRLYGPSFFHDTCMFRSTRKISVMISAGGLPVVHPSIRGVATSSTFRLNVTHVLVGYAQLLSYSVESLKSVKYPKTAQAELKRQYGLNPDRPWSGRLKSQIGLVNAHFTM